MKTTHFTPVVWLGIAALTTTAWTQDAAPAAAKPPVPEAAPAPAARAAGALRFNFRAAPLEAVLN